MRCQAEFTCVFYQGNQFTRKWLTDKPLAKINLPTPPTIGTYMVFDGQKEYFRVHQVCWIETNGQFAVHVFVDPMI